MACTENKCTNRRCNFYQFSNSTVTICPICGSTVLNFYDTPTEYESPVGDDYEETN